LHIYSPPLFQAELKKSRLAGNRWTYFGVRVPRTHWTIQSSYKHKSALKCTLWSQLMHACPRQTGGWTDEHHGNSARIRSNESITR